MTLHEFDIIHNIFATQATSRNDVILGIGDDAAITTVPANQQLVMTIDTLVAGVHFFENTPAEDIAHKALAVNLSDLASMGATPAWITLALTIPQANQAWLKDFARGLFALANQYHTQLIGGDMTRGPLSITIQAHGFVPQDSAIRRDQAKAGDFIYVSNTLGDAGLALKLFSEKNIPPSALKKLLRPEPQILLGEKLRGIATSAIDISDGLAADLNHILEKSHVGASINIDSLPLSDEVTSREDAIELALTAGDDYELCFTVPEEKTHLLSSIMQMHKITCIGKINSSGKLNLHNQHGIEYVLKTQGYQHF